jgi:GDPmannose 4,6-dehydratase
VAFHLAGFDSWEPYVSHDTRFDRPAEVDLLIGDATKAKTKLGWEPRVNFEGLVKMMYEADLEEEAREARRET